MEAVRLGDGSFFKGLETVTALARVSEFDTILGERIVQGGAKRAVLAMRRELIPEPPAQVVVTGNIGPYRSAAGLVLPPDHVIVLFAYASTPSMAELKKTYKGGVSAIFDGRKWKKHAVSIMAGALTPGEQIVWLAAPPSEVLSDSEEIIAWGDSQRTEIAPNGYRPMMGHNELLDLHTAHPELYKQFWMPALGSFTCDGDDHRYVAVLHARDGKPCLDDHWFDRDWNAGHRFPFVRK